ncbi:MFS transporter [Amycolatopsis taiwanensis]|uniref:MFS transporter n=1 Tax=Amycolatopsis taiwanensis TaxID=342230 RepID=A0A9W6R7W8_9PSEU|nr:MFS transporter [Amycolatopsis taiwanensis]GLY70453.1 MFS transporter [Amycolatopsis taiwanensis]
MTEHVDGVVSGEPAPPRVVARPGSTGSVFARPYQALTLGVVLSVGTVAFESLGVATVLPGIAESLNGLGAYGWGLSALMLANIIGTVIAGRSADRSGPWRPMSAALLVFAAGCVLAGVAGSWPLFLIGRFVQGLGVGAVMAMAYTMIGLAYPEHLRARMFALLSSAWTVPSLVGPVVAGILTEHTTWRAVFVLMLPLIAVAATMTLPGLRRLRPPEGIGFPENSSTTRWWKSPQASAVLLTVGTGLLLQALLLSNVAVLAALAVVGVAIAVLGLRRTTPEGTMTARAGIGAGVVIRALLCGVYFGSEALLPLGLQQLRGLSTAEAGLGLSAGALTWVAGSMLQAKLDGTRPGQRTRGVAFGFAVLLAGVAIIAVSILSGAVPAYFAVLGWGIGGLGMGVAFNASTTDTLEQTPAGRQGEVSAALQLAQTLATGVLAGLGGAAIAIVRHHGTAIGPAFLGTFAFTGLLALLGVFLSPRLRPADARQP